MNTEEKKVSAKFAYDTASLFRGEAELFRMRYEYWRKRCEAAERFMAAHSCFPPVTDQKKKEYQDWYEIASQVTNG